MCEWAEQRGNGQIHFVCPMWDRKESEDKKWNDYGTYICCCQSQ